MNRFLRKLLCLTIVGALLASLFFPIGDRIQASGFSLIVLSRYSNTIRIGDSFFLGAVVTTGKAPTYKSSNSQIASVNSYGQVKGKKPGSCDIVVKSKNVESSCRVTVLKTQITLSATSISLENKKTYKLSWKTSNGSGVTFKSNKKSVATVSDSGLVTAEKPGEATITAKANTTTVTCHVTVKKPTVTLSKTSLSLYKNQTAKITASVSSGRKPSWKSSKSSVAYIDDGIVYPVKHGQTLIKASVDGVTKVCKVSVVKPRIDVSPSSLSIKVSKKETLKVTVSSGEKATFSSSNKKIATVNSNGVVTGRKKGKCKICVACDGTKKKISVTVKK